MNSKAKPTTGFRANTTRSRTTPAHDWANWPDVIEAFCKRLRGVVVENLPAAEIMRRHDTKNTLHYCDPPYPKSTRSDKGDDYRFEMSDDDHRHLAADLKQLDGMVVLSGYPCDLYDIELFADWHRVTRDTFADGAGKRTECLWLNAAAWERLQAPTTGLFAGVQS